MLSPETGAILSCQDDHCVDLCGATPKSGGQSCGLLGVGVDCASYCCAEFKECFDDPACLRASNCGSCNLLLSSSNELMTDQCFAGCMNSVPDAGSSWGPKLDALRECVDHAGPCNGPTLNGGGNPKDYWNCVNGADPQPSKAPVTIYAWVGDPLLTPFPQGTVVDECSALGDCSKPIFSSPLGTNGVAAFLAKPDLITNRIAPYFRIASPPSDFSPLILILSAGVTHTSVARWAVETKKSIVDTVTTPLGINQSPTLGQIGFAISSCSSILGPYSTPLRVKVTPTDPTTVIVGSRGSGYVRGGATDSKGYVFNVPPGKATVEYYIESDAGERRIGTRDVWVEAGWLTAVLLVPG
jgi:hypothetical protein